VTLNSRADREQLLKEAAASTYRVAQFVSNVDTHVPHYTASHYKRHNIHRDVYGLLYHPLISQSTLEIQQPHDFHIYTPTPPASIECISINTLCTPIMFQEVKVPRFHENSTGWWYGCQPYALATLTPRKCSWY